MLADRVRMGSSAKTRLSFLYSYGREFVPLLFRTSWDFGYPPVDPLEDRLKFYCNGSANVSVIADRAIDFTNVQSVKVEFQYVDSTIEFGSSGNNNPWTYGELRVLFLDENYSVGDNFNIYGGEEEFYIEPQSTQENLSIQTLVFDVSDVQGIYKFVFGHHFGYTKKYIFNVYSIELIY